MPIFKSRTHSFSEDNHPGYSSRKRNIFSTRSSPPGTSRGGNGSNRDFVASGSDSDSEHHSGNGGTRRRGLLRRRRSDRNKILHEPTILAAHQKVTDAEAAERGADLALAQARNMVKEAKKHVQILEHEALEETSRAKKKQAEAKNVRKSFRALGRHG